MNKLNLNIKQTSKLIYTLITLVCILFSSQNYSQSITTKLNRDSIFIGEPIELTIEIKDAKNISPIYFKVGDSIGKNFEILELGKTDSLQSSIKQNVIITSYEIGNYLFPPIGIFVDGKKIISTPISVYISLVNADTALPIRDIKTIVMDPITFKDKIKMFFNWAVSNWYYVVAIVLILIFLIWFFFFRKKKVIEKQEPKKPKIPAHILAFGKLKELEDKELWQNDNQKQYNVELTEVIQNYITNRYNVPTSEKTSTEIIDSLKFIKLGETNQNNLKKLLMLSDLVKFAKEKPTANENEQVLKDAFDFIKTTKGEK